MMSLRTILCMLLAFLIIQMVTHCDGELRVRPGNRMRTEPDKPVAGQPFDVFCSHNEHNKEQRRVQISMYAYIKNRSEDVLTVRVNDTTVRHRVTRSPPGQFKVFDFNCYVQDDLALQLKRYVTPVPDLKDFVCSLEALMLGNHSVNIRKWDSTQPATVTIWRKNKKGRSVNSSQIMVPILTNAEQRQPRAVCYHINNNTVRWRPPIEKHNLIGYIVFWCLSAITPRARATIIELEGPQELFLFNKSIALYHTVVAAKYSDNISGGMMWSRPKPNEYNSFSYLARTLIFVMMTFGLIRLFIYIFRKITAMEEIPGELPEHLLVGFKLRRIPKVMTLT